MSTVLFGAVTVWHRHLLSKVLWFLFPKIAYTKTTQKVNKNKNRNFFKFLFKNFILKNFSFLLLQNMVRADPSISSGQVVFWVLWQFWCTGRDSLLTGAVQVSHPAFAKLCRIWDNLFESPTRTKQFVRSVQIEIKNS
ncbi:MAG: hypothetical protein A2653_01700 [Candidatus Zambryskibacteria bacterium RIFCSPHIGHO2_01_FULL_43_25]|nr:MAG: hypothetical protein A2653_01700 [Candidatus Zambryskibacteria bacterium RIFCSPHIGHO2_01_FULL_43_25]